MKTSVTVLLFMSLFGMSFNFYVIHFFVKESMAWDNALTYCKEHHHDLSTVSKEDLQQLSNNAQDDYYWIGLKKVNHEQNLWNWSEGGMAVINKWDNEQPDNDAEKCGAVKRSSSKLHDAPCSWAIPFYCMEVFELFLVQQENTWEEALDYCRQHYIDLAIISAEMIMTEAKSTVTAAQTEDVWTGLRFLAGYWFWVNGTDLHYTAWSVEGELQCPAMNQRCGILNRDEKLWKSTDCDRRLNFLCVRRAHTNY
ncbi:secretory phospholipase A2 receptor-like [Myxocyprinus asiaticus]|uniref:secretory phospholipase A2 receptor-like n=1 Tax=Myxocyprinus asiaticus TaxID=70543 RepID=UPI002221B31F|nr:secretory phospholipase A2 receptor-like [Myxocyprinus asiaticus]